MEPEPISITDPRPRRTCRGRRCRVCGSHGDRGDGAAGAERPRALAGPLRAGRRGAGTGASTCCCARPCDAPCGPSSQKRSTPRYVRRLVGPATCRRQDGGGMAIEGRNVPGAGSRGATAGTATSRAVGGPVRRGIGHPAPLRSPGTTAAAELGAAVTAAIPPGGHRARARTAAPRSTQGRPGGDRPAAGSGQADRQERIDLLLHQGRSWNWTVSPDTGQPASGWRVGGRTPTEW